MDDLFENLPEGDCFEDEECILDTNTATISPTTVVRFQPRVLPNPDPGQNLIEPTQQPHNEPAHRRTAPGAKESRKAALNKKTPSVDVTKVSFSFRSEFPFSALSKNVHPRGD